VDRARVAEISFFAGLSDSELDALARSAREVEFAEGEALTTQGDLGHCLYVIESGSGRVVADGGSAGEVGPGDVVGEIAVLASGRRTVSVVASEPVRALAWFKRDVWALEEDAPEAARRLRIAIDEHLASRTADQHH
jgi:CRP/FNR family transcriptional regulator, cyclic AMP receptor protein